MLIQNPGVVPQGLKAPRTAHTPRAPSKVPPILSPMLVAFPVRNPDSGPTSFLGPGTLVLLESAALWGWSHGVRSHRGLPWPRPRQTPGVPLPSPARSRHHHRVSRSTHAFLLCGVGTGVTQGSEDISDHKRP